MTLLDRELSWCAGRTRPRAARRRRRPRRSSSPSSPAPARPDVGNLAVYVVATLLLAAALLRRPRRGRRRLHRRDRPAVAAPAPRRHRTPETLAVLPVVGIALLASSDLVDRFERAPSRLRWLPNPWAGFTAAETRSLRWAAYAAGALTGLLDHTLQLVRPRRPHLVHALPRGGPASPWSPSMLALALLCLGRAVGAPARVGHRRRRRRARRPLAWQAERHRAYTPTLQPRARKTFASRGPPATPDAIRHLC
jgi:hypothetical protein